MPVRMIASRRSVSAALLGVGWLLGSAQPAYAHGLGGRSDLPVPVSYFVAGAGIVLILSFAALAALWPTARLQTLPEGRALTGGWVRVLGAIGVAVGLLGFLLVVVGGAIGIQEATRNPANVLVFVWFWLAIPFLSAVVGDVYPAMSPWIGLSRLTGLGRAEDPDKARDWGYVPAAAAFVAFTWMELNSPYNTPRILAIAALIYTAWVLAAGEVVGVQGARLSADGFGVYNHLLGAIGPVRRDDDGTLRWVGWLRSLPVIEERRGLVLFVVAMIGTVSYDGLERTPLWQNSVLPWLRDVLPAMSNNVERMVLGTIFELAVIALVYGAYLAASAVAARMVGGEWTAAVVARRFAHTLVPIGLAYAVAHYFTLLIFEGQYLLSTISDPFGQGWDLFGTADRRIDFSLISNGTAWVWYVQVAVIVAGHVAGVVLAHDRALADFPARDAVRSQYAMLGLMVLLTGFGLMLLSAG